MLDSMYHETLVYKEYLGKSDSGTDRFAPERYIHGLRLSGRIRVTHNDDGDTTSCDITYRTKERLVAKSLLNGREISESVAIDAFGLNVGYKNYVK